MDYRNVRLGAVLLVVGLLVGDSPSLQGESAALPAQKQKNRFFGTDKGALPKVAATSQKKSGNSSISYDVTDKNDLDNLNLDRKKAKDVSPKQEFNKLREKKIKALYLRMQADVVDAEQKLIARLQGEIASLKAYTKNDSKAFVSYLDDMVVDFRSQMQVEQTIMVSDYFSFVKDNDPGFVYAGKLTQDERVFIEGIQSIIQEAVVRVQALVIDLTSQQLTDRLSVELSHGFYDSKLQAQRAYEKQKEQNEIQLNHSWWDNLQTRGESLLSESATQFKAAVSKEAKKQVETVIVEIGGDIASGAGKKAINFAKDNISPSVAVKIDQLGSYLKSHKLLSLLDGNSDIAVIALKKAIRLKYPIAAPTGPVVVRTSKGLCPEETEYLKQRMPKVQKVLNDAFGISEPLRIAFCCSGGGNRAMVGTLGMFMAASRHNFLQAAVYCAGLSGSTWTIAPWSYLYLKGLLSQRSYEKSFKDLQSSFFTVLNDPTMKDPTNKGLFLPPMLGGDVTSIFSNQMAVRFGFNQHLSMVDVWAALIGNYALKLVGGARLQVRWSELYDLAQKGDIPLPLCSAAFDARLDNAGSRNQEVGALYDWLETGPFEAGSTVLGYIPMKHFGCEFKDGKLVVDMMQHEYPMSFWLGVYGSAFSLTLNDAIEKGLPVPTVDVFGHAVKVPVDAWVKQIIDENYGADVRSKRAGKIHAQMPNFSVGLKDSLLKNKENIGLFDGGIAFNIPLPLVLDQVERGVDIVIMYDSNPADVQTLKNADAYFKRKKISMPIMGNRSKADLLSRTMTVFNDPRDRKAYNSTQPTLIYFPTNLDVSKPPFTTANFRYTKADVTKLVDTVDDAFESQVPDMKDILKLVAKARYAGTRKKAL